MKSQIAFVLFSLSPFCQAQTVVSVCPSAKASLCKGCCFTDVKFQAACAKISDETECGKQIACQWSDGPVSGAVYSAFDAFTNVDITFFDCYQSKNISALIAHMATLEDNVESAQYHAKKVPVSGACEECWSASYIEKRLYEFPYSKIVAPGITEYSDRRLKKASEALEGQAVVV